MSTSQKHDCFDRLILERLLAEQLQGSEEASVLEHIETCESCRDVMARIAGDDQLRGEIQQHFSDHSIDDPGAATMLESTASHADILQIKGLLGPTDDPDMLGRLGAYEISGIVGRGSTGVVFKALDKRLNRFVAIKMLLPSYSGSGPARSRFEREGRSIASVRDEHVIPVFAVDEHQGLPFIVMEYMPAGSLEQRIDMNGALDTGEVVRIGMQIAQALAAAHKQGIVHRDVKPANVLLANGVERALVTDFGLARILDETSMTRSGAISGTPQFMSPEQARGETVDHRSDLFSLGSVMYAAATGHSPFRSETVFGVIKRVCETEPRPIRETNGRIKGWLCDFIDKLHAKNPVDRFQTAREVSDLLAEELAYFQSPAIVPRPERNWRRKAVLPGLSGRNARRAAAGIGVAGVVGMALMAALTGSTGKQPEAGQESEVTIRPDDQARYTPNSLSRFSRGRAVQFEFKHTANPDTPPVVRMESDDFRQGMVFLEKGKYLPAIDSFEKAIEYGDRTAAACYNIGCAHALLGNTGSALDSLEQAFECGFRNVDQYVHDSDLDSIRSEPRLRKLIVQMTMDVQVDKLQARAISLRRQARYSEAEALYRSILGMKPDHKQAIQELGLSLHMQGKLNEAILWHRKAAEIPEYEELGNYNIGCYYALRGEKDEAFLYLSRAIDAGFEDVIHIETDSDLDSVRADDRYERMLESIESEWREQDWTEHEKQCHEALDSIRSNDIKALESQLTTVDPNCSCPNYRLPRRSALLPRKSPLTFAAEIGNLDAANVLMFQGADVNRIPKGGLSPLMSAARHGHLKLVKAFIEGGAKLEVRSEQVGTALMAAAARGHSDIVSFLLKQGANVNATVSRLGTPLIVGIRARQHEIVRMLLRNNASIETKVTGIGTALIAAAYVGDVEMIELLTSHGANVNECVDGVGTPLSVSIRAGHRKVFEALLDEGADISSDSTLAGNALIAAARNDRLQFLERISEKGANLDATVDGRGTALGVAVQCGEADAAHYLLSVGADPNIWADGVSTPLAMAVSNNDRHLTTLLLNRGAFPDLQPPGTKSAIAVAEAGGNTNLIELLQECRPKD